MSTMVVSRLRPGEGGALRLFASQEALLAFAIIGVAILVGLDNPRFLATRNLTDIVLGLLYVIAGLLLVMQMLMRLAWIDVLLVAAPVAAACWVLPQTQGWAQSWNQHFTGAVFTQFVQVVALKLGGMLLVAVVRLEPDVTWLSFLMGAATLWLTFRIPSLMRAGAGGNIADFLLRELARRLVRSVGA